MTATNVRSVPGPEASPVRLPVIKGEGWFDAGNKPFILTVEYPLSAEEMVAALYGIVEDRDIASDEDLCGSVAVTLAIEGLPALSARATKIRLDEQRGTIQSARFLSECRDRVTALLRGGSPSFLQQEDGYKS